MRLRSAPIVNHHARTFTVTVKEKPGGVCSACLGDDPLKKEDIARNWGQKSFWGEKGWNDSRDKKDLWKNVLDAFENDNRYEKEKNYTVNFQHCATDGRCKELGLNKESGEEEARSRKHDAEWVEWAKANGYLPHADEINHSVTDLVGGEEIGLKKRSAPDDRTQAILPQIPDAKSFINRIISVRGQPERNMEDVVKELLVLLGHPTNRIVFQRGRVDLILQDSSRKPAFVFEVKRSIASESERAKARRQANDYADQTGAQFLVITDGDRYEIYDRHRGWDFASWFCGRFQLTQFDATSAAVFDLLRYQN
jgi:Type I restriction enzyme R protein N terminus (HSDR_N)